MTGPRGEGRTGDWLVDVAGFTDRERALYALYQVRDVASARWVASRWTGDMQDIADTEREMVGKLVSVLVAEQEQP